LDTAVDSNVTYYYLLRSVDKFGNLSAESNEVTTSLSLPLPVTAFYSQVVDGDIRLEWTKSGDDGAGLNHVSSYKIFRSTTNSGDYSVIPIKTVLKGITSWTDNTVISNIDYYYVIYAVDKSGNRSSQSIGLNNVKVPLPSPVTSFSASVQDDTIVLNWTKSADDNDGINDVVAYNVYRSTVSGSYGQTPIKVLNNGVLTWTDTTVEIGIDYYYMIRAVDKYTNLSLASQEIIKNIPYIKPPTNIGSSVVQGGHISVSWIKSVDDGTGTGLVIQYYVYRTTVAGTFGINPVAVLQKGSTGYLDSEVKSNIDYYYMVRARDTKGGLSVDSSVTNKKIPVPEPPSDCFSYTYYAGDRNNVSINWTLSTDDSAGISHVKSYNVYRSTVSGSYTDSSVVLVKGVTYYIDIDSNIVVGVEYYYTVIAVDTSDNRSVRSNETKIKVVYREQVVDNTKQETVKLVTDIGLVEVEFSPQSTNKTDTLTIRQISSQVYPDKKVNLFNDAWDFKFAAQDTVLTKEVVMRLPYNRAKLVADNINEKLLRVCWYNPDKTKWEYVNTSAVLPGDNRVEAKVSHFSVFGIAAYKYTGKLLEDREVYVYPNPAKSVNTVNFKFKIYDVFGSINIKITVYNVAQQAVMFKEQSFGEDSAGLVKEIQWDITNIASGVYVFKLEGSSGEFTKTITKKLAIIK
jgi:hypothetical protein